MCLFKKMIIFVLKMKIEHGKKAVARNGNEQDAIYARHILCVLINDSKQVRRTKKRMARRLRRSGKIILKNLQKNLVI